MIRITHLIANFLEDFPVSLFILVTISPYIKDMVGLPVFPAFILVLSSQQSLGFTYHSMKIVNESFT